MYQDYCGSREAMVWVICELVMCAPRTKHQAEFSTSTVIKIHRKLSSAHPNPIVQPQPKNASQSSQMVLIYTMCDL
jgi:hypothetical protein